LLDLALSHNTGLLALRQIRGSGADARIIVLVSGVDQREILSALQLGARGAVVKKAAAECLLRGIRSAMEGNYWIGDEQLADVFEAVRNVMAGHTPAGTPLGLTEREIQIVALIAAGGTNRKIAERLCLSEVTVKHHLTRIFHKVGVSSRLELALFAAHHHISI
jgi:two-component system nitrate/nitrite response regulator NarL